MPEACSFIKKETLAQVFSCEFCEISKKTFFTEHLWWLLLLRTKFPKQPSFHKEIPFMLPFGLHLHEKWNRSMHNVPRNGVTWTYFWYISWSPTSLQPLSHLTLRIYDTVLSLSWLKKDAIFDDPRFCFFKPANMRIHSFRIGVTWSFIAAIAGHMNYYKLLEH